MMLSYAESARAIFIRTLDIGSTVRVPELKGRGKVVGLSGTITVDMVTGPYRSHRFELGWDQVTDARTL